MTSEPGKSLVRQLFDIVYGSVPVEFESACSLEESVQHLSAATRRSVFRALTTEAAVGKVSAQRVSLQRVIPFLGNSFKPFFVGKFHNNDGRIILIGQFTMLWFTKAFMTFWLGFCALWTMLATVIAILTLIGRLPGEATVWILPLAGAGMFAMGIAFLTFAKRLSAKDIPWLTRVIQDALSKDAK